MQEESSLAAVMGAEGPTWGVVLGGDALAPGSATRGAPPTLLDLVRSDDPDRWIAAAREHEASPFDVRQVLPPIPAGAVEMIAIGLNYQEHADESREHTGVVDRPAAPVVFGKASSSIIGPYADVVIDPAVTPDVDWEVELAVIIGRPGRDIQPEDALGHVFGYTIGNDLSARDIQFGPGGQWYLGKSFDGFCPLGPVVVRPPMGDFGARSLRLQVNGEPKQAATTSDLIFSITELIVHLSRARTLLAGTVILSGTPAGVGFTRTPPERLADGDVVEAEIEGIGKLVNRIVMR